MILFLDLYDSYLRPNRRELRTHGAVEFLTEEGNSSEVSW